MRCEPADELPDGRLVVSSAERNRRPILKVLERVLPKTGLVLEIDRRQPASISVGCQLNPFNAWAK
jgi:hypothetical protein